MGKHSEILEDSKRRLAQLRSLKSGSHIHIICVSGTLTGSLAKLLKDRGFYVTGSDKAFYPPMGDFVKSTIDMVYQGFSKKNLEKKPDFVLIGNAARSDNEEVLEVLDKKIPYASMPEAINAFLIKDTSIVISGTHGKTTTTAACAHVFRAAKKDPSYFIGGLPNDLPTSIYVSNGEFSILEGDEYDSSFFQKIAKFHFYRPNILAVTSLEFDHADIYDSIEDIENEFVEVISKMPEGSTVLFCDEEERLVSLSKKIKTNAKIVFYGTEESSNYRITRRNVEKVSFNLAGESLDLTLKVSGFHNALNLLLVAAIAKISGINLKEIKKGLESFSGVCRREEVLYNKNDILLIEDFAHHPTAVKTTLEGLRERYPDKRIIAVLEPRSNTSRRHFFQKKFAKSFEAADLVFFLEGETEGIYSGTGGEIKGLDFEKLCEDLGEAKSFSDPKQLALFLGEELKEGDLVVMMSNGDFRGFKEEFIGMIM